MSKEFSKKSLISFISIILFLAILSLNIFIIMIIWNKVIIKKFPSQNIQELNFWEALAIAVFTTMISSHQIVKISRYYV